jgi:transcriptional activator SPT8
MGSILPGKVVLNSPHSFQNIIVGCSASIDNIRLWNAAEAGEPDASGKMKSGVQFKIIPGHHGGYISQMCESLCFLSFPNNLTGRFNLKVVDPAARFLVSASSNRGWHGDSTRTVFVHDVKHIQ